ncbi:hypothetical protein MKW98_025568, partial [Papaver atlanticum]
VNHLCTAMWVMNVFCLQTVQLSPVNAAIMLKPRPDSMPNPNNIVEAGGIPLIDLSPLNDFCHSNDEDSAHDSARHTDLVTKIGRACKEWGFFQVFNHGVSSDLQQRVEAAVKKFFDLSSEEKRKVKRDEVNPMGYYDTEHTKNVRDWKEVFDFSREVCEEYASALEKLSFELLELIALSLGLPEKRLNGYFNDDHTSFIRFNHYPPCPEPHLALGVGRHKDAGALTVLAQDDVGGLDVKRKTDDEWVRVKPIPGSYIVNVGDIIQVWSNDKYESAEHRVTVDSKRERFSIPFFFNPSHHVMVKPLEELVDHQNPAKYKEYNWGKFFKTRKMSNFKKLDAENIQIYHFKRFVV